MIDQFYLKFVGLRCFVLSLPLNWHRAAAAFLFGSAPSRSYNTRSAAGRKWNEELRVLLDLLGILHHSWLKRSPNMRCNATTFNDAHLCSPRFLLRCPLRCLLWWILLILRGSYKKYLKLFIEAHLEDPPKISILGFHPIEMFNDIPEYSMLPIWYLQSWSKIFIMCFHNNQ